MGAGASAELAQTQEELAVCAKERGEDFHQTLLEKAMEAIGEAESGGSGAAAPSVDVKSGIIEYGSLKTLHAILARFVTGEMAERLAQISTAAAAPGPAPPQTRSQCCSPGGTSCATTRRARRR